MDENVKQPTPQVYQRDERTWKQLPIEDRIERLRNVVQDLRRSLGWTREMARTAKDMAENHEHSQSGKALFSSQSLQGGRGIEVSGCDELA